MQKRSKYLKENKAKKCVTKLHLSSTQKKNLSDTASCNRTRSNGYELKYNKFWFNMRKKHLYIVRTNTGRDCQKKLWSLQAWRLVKSQNGHSPEEAVSAVLKKGNWVADFHRSLPITPPILPRIWMNPKLHEHTSSVYPALSNDTCTNNCSIYSYVTQTLRFKKAAKSTSKRIEDNTHSDSRNSPESNFLSLIVCR